MNTFVTQLLTAFLLLISLPILALSKTNLEQLSRDLSTQLTPAQLAQPDLYYDVKISPDGEHFAAVVLNDGKRKVVFFNTESLEMVGKFGFSKQNEVGEILWVNNERIVIKILKKSKYNDEPKYFGELYAVNYDGEKGKLIYGYRVKGNNSSVKSNNKKAIFGWAEIVDRLPEDNKNILISSTPMSKSGGQRAKIYKMDVYDGALSEYFGEVPVAYAEVLTDQQSNLRLALGIDNSYSKRAYTYNLDNKSWSELPVGTFSSGFEPLSFDVSGDWLFALDNLEQDKVGLVKLSLKTGERKTIYQHKHVDITNVEFNSSGNSVFAARIDLDYPAYVIIDKTNDEAEVFKMLLSAFAGSKVRITSKSIDGSKRIVHVSSDINPSIYYLYDSHKQRISYLLSNASDINPELFSSSQAIEFTNREGIVIRGYLSTPVNAKSDAKLPLVTLVHGGPHNVRDFWLYDSEVQLLTSQGYAVLRVNFRGSGGYGLKHQEAGYQRWGDAMQHDIIDGTKWAIENHNIDANKVCIMGTSFGGYSAVQSATIEPELFQCVVANAGVYDLEMMFELGDIPEVGFGESYLEMALGTDKARLREFSPVHHVDKLKAAIMIAHGEKDRRVPFEQAEQLADKLKKVGKKYRWFVRSKEGHGFFNVENRIDYYEEVADFMKEHLQ